MLGAVLVRPNQGFKA